MPKDLALPDNPELFPYARNHVDGSIGYQIERMVRCLTDPIIVYPGWEDSVPGKLKEEIPAERLLRTYKKESDIECGDLEAMAYLYTASLSVSLDDHWGKIYVNLAKQYMSKLGLELDGISADELTEQEYQMLGDLKRWIRSQQRKGRK